MDQKGDSERLQSRCRVRQDNDCTPPGIVDHRLLEDLRGREYPLLLVEAAEDQDLAVE
jgi:hypothetical protein